MVGVKYPVIAILRIECGIKVVVFFSGALRPSVVHEQLRRLWCPVSIPIAHRSPMRLQDRIGLFAILFTSRRIKLYIYMYVCMHACMQYDCLHTCSALLFRGASSILVNCFAVAARRYCLACITSMSIIIKMHDFPFFERGEHCKSAAQESIE